MKELIVKIYYSICEDTGEKIYDTELMQEEFALVLQNYKMKNEKRKI